MRIGALTPTRIPRRISPGPDLQLRISSNSPACPVIFGRRQMVPDVSRWVGLGESPSARTGLSIPARETRTKS
jgi:hypothetical protein